MVHVGMDLHHRHSTVRALTEDGELLPPRKIYHDRMEGLWQYLDDFGDEPIRVVFEAISNARWMYRLLGQRPKLEPVAVTPHKVRIIAETVSKTDKIDAGKLAWLSSVNMLPRAWLPDERVERLREMTRHRTGLLRMQTCGKNQVNGVLVRVGLQRPYANIFGPLGRRWLTELDLPAVMRLQVDHWLALLDELGPRILQMDRRIGRLIQDDPIWARAAELLATIPGVGKVTISTILAELGDWRRFQRRSQVASFAGLVPASKRSANTKRYGHISKRGSKELRRVLTEVAQGVARRVPRYGRLYARVAEQKCANVAKTAVARRLIEDAWTILMKDEPFRLMPVQAESRVRVG
ncbi:MAG: IS110 family RNA-guided transposase [Planctomycetota bacterium]